MTTSSPRGGTLWFTEGRRLAADRMWMKHGGELNIPHPLDAVKGPPPIADADPAGCEFLVRDEDTQRQRRCNEPAVCQEPRHLRYCQAHKEQVERSMHYAKKTIVLIPFQ